MFCLNSSSVSSWLDPEVRKLQLKEFTTTTTTRPSGSQLLLVDETNARGAVGAAGRDASGVPEDASGLGVDSVVVGRFGRYRSANRVGRREHPDGRRRSRLPFRSSSAPLYAVADEDDGLHGADGRDDADDGADDVAEQPLRSCSCGRRLVEYATVEVFKVRARRVPHQGHRARRAERLRLRERGGRSRIERRKSRGDLFYILHCML